MSAHQSSTRMTRSSSNRSNQSASSPNTSPFERLSELNGGENFDDSPSYNLRSRNARGSKRKADDLLEEGGSDGAHKVTSKSSISAKINDVVFGQADTLNTICHQRAISSSSQSPCKNGSFDAHSPRNSAVGVTGTVDNPIEIDDKDDSDNCTDVVPVGKGKVTSLRSMSMEVMLQIAGNLDNMKNVHNLRLSCRHARDNIDYSIFKVFFLKEFDDLERNGQVMQYRKAYESLITLSNSWIVFDNGHNRLTNEVVRILRDLVVNAVGRVVPGPRYDQDTVSPKAYNWQHSTVTGRNFKFLWRFLVHIQAGEIGSNLIEMTGRTPLFIRRRLSSYARPIAIGGAPASEPILALQLSLLHLTLAPLGRLMSYRDFIGHQNLTYQDENKLPLFFGHLKGEVNFRWFLSTAMFFRYHLLHVGRFGDSSELSDVYLDRRGHFCRDDASNRGGLPIPAPQPWVGKLSNGTQKLGRSWVGTYLAMPDQRDLIKMRRGVDIEGLYDISECAAGGCGFQHIIFDFDLENEDAKFRYRQLGADEPRHRSRPTAPCPDDGTSGELRLPPVVDFFGLSNGGIDPQTVGVHPVQNAWIGGVNAQAGMHFGPATNLPPLPAGYQWMMAGAAGGFQVPQQPPNPPPSDQRWHVTGRLHALPPQYGIPGWQRVCFTKSMALLNNQGNLVHEEWEYEGVVIPGGQMIIGRWWNPNLGDIGDGGRYCGPFVLWHIEDGVGDEEVQKAQDKHRHADYASWLEEQGFSL